MYLSEMGPNSRMIVPSDLKIRDMDQNHNWINDDITTTREFIKQVSTNNKGIIQENNDEDVDIQKLNQKQKVVFKRI